MAKEIYEDPGAELLLWQQPSSGNISPHCASKVCRSIHHVVMVHKDWAASPVDGVFSILLHGKPYT
jgi:hypothetical protein